MSLLLKLTEDIYTLIEPHFKPKESKLVKFEIVNYVLFRLYYDEVIEITHHMPFDYFNAYSEIFSDYISNPQSRFMQKEILKRNRMYVQVHYFAKYNEPGNYTNLSPILFTLVKYISTKIQENNIRFPVSLFQKEPAFPSDPGEKLSTKMEGLIMQAFEKQKQFLFVALN